MTILTDYNKILSLRCLVSSKYDESFKEVNNLMRIYGKIIIIIMKGLGQIYE